MDLMPFLNRMAVARNVRGWLEKNRRRIEKILGLARLYSTYTLNAWLFQTGNTRSLMASLSTADKTKFPYFPSDVWDWDSFWSERHVLGMRRWVLNERATAEVQQPASKL